MFPHFLRPYRNIGMENPDAFYCDREWKVFSFVKYRYCSPLDHACFYVFEREHLYEDSNVSFMVNNLWFQLIVSFRKLKSGRNIEFLIHLKREVEREMDASNPVHRLLFSEIMDDVDYAGNDFDHVVDIIPAASTCCSFDRVLTLKETATLYLLISLYNRDKVAMVMDMISSCEISAIHTFLFYQDLSKYIYTNQLSLARAHFKGDLSALNCIFFTCISLSDVRFFERYFRHINGGVPSIILYFYSMFLMLTNKNTKRIVSRDGLFGVPESEGDVENFGSFLPPLASANNNALHLTLNKIQ